MSHDCTGELLLMCGLAGLMASVSDLLDRVFRTLRADSTMNASSRKPTGMKGKAIVRCGFYMFQVNNFG